MLAALAGPQYAEPVGTGLDSPGVPDEETVLRAGAPSGRTRRRVLTGLVAAGLVLAGGGGATALVHFLSPDDTPAVGTTPQAEASASAEPSAEPSPSPTRKEKPKATPSATRESSPVSTPAPPVEQDAAPAQFQPGTVVIPAQMQVGQAIVAEASGWTPEPASTACLWSIGGEERDNLGSCTYTVALDDVGKAVQVKLTAAQTGYAAALSNATDAVPQPSVPKPGCEILLSPGEVHSGWFAHCEVEQDPKVTYTWNWYDMDDAETITWEYAPGPRIWIGGDRAAHRVRVTVTAEREGYRPAEFRTTFTLPDEWVPAE